MSNRCSSVRMGGAAFAVGLGLAVSYGQPVAWATPADEGSSPVSEQPTDSGPAAAGSAAPPAQSKAGEPLPSEPAMSDSEGSPATLTGSHQSPASSPVAVSGGAQLRSPNARSGAPRSRIHDVLSSADVGEPRPPAEVIQPPAAEQPGPIDAQVPPPAQESSNDSEPVSDEGWTHRRGSDSRITNRLASAARPELGLAEAATARSRPKLGEATPGDAIEPGSAGEVAAAAQIVEPQVDTEPVAPVRADAVSPVDAVEEQPSPPARVWFAFLTAMGLRPPTATPGAPAGPPVSLLELAYAGWQRIRSTSVHQTPTATLAIDRDEEALPQLITGDPAIDSQGADPTITTAAVSPDLSTAAVEQPAASPQLVVTGPPSFLDQFNVFNMRMQRFTDQIVGTVLKIVSSVIGFDLYTPWENSRGGCALCSDTASPITTAGLNVSQTDYNGWKVWEIAPPNPSGSYVIAIHGGGYVFQPDVSHWNDYATMARETGATVIVPIYQLESDGGRAAEVVPEMADFIADQVAAHPGKVSVYGDSSGASIALSAVQLLVADGRGLPSNMVLLSPGMDFTLSNPKIKSIDDPVFEYQQLYDRFQNWSWDDGLDLTDPLVSPLYGDFAGFPPTTVYVGSLELFGPDVLALYQKAVAEDAPISVVIGQGQIHDWALAATPWANSQAPAARPYIYAQLGLTR